MTGIFLFTVGGKEEIWQANREILFSSTKLLKPFIKKERFLFDWGKTMGFFLGLYSTYHWF